MKHYLLIILLLIGFLFLCKAESKSMYAIAFELRNSKNGEEFYLQTYHGKTLTSIGSIYYSNDKKNTFNEDASLQPGMYALSINKKPLVNFFISDTTNQDFSISLDVNNLPQSIAFTNSPENQAFIEYLRFLGEQQRTQEAQAAVKQKGDELTMQFPNSMLALFIKTMQEPKIPEPNYPINDYQEYAMNYYINHFWDNVDFSDQRLLNTPLLEQKLSTYFKQMVQTEPETIIEKVALVLYKASTNERVYNWTVRYLYKLYREAPIPRNTEVYNSIGENYILPEPKRWDAAFIEKVKRRVTKSKLNPVGEKATNLILQTPSGKTQELYKVDAKYTILLFYNPDCEACQPVSEALEKLYSQYKSKGIEVFAVYMDHKKEEFENYITSEKLNWINVYDPTGFKASIEEKYDLYAIPMIYLLDECKNVIKKDIMVNELENYINNVQ